MNAKDFAPVPPPLLGADQIVTLPNKSGIYFIWEGSVVAYVGRSINLARRLLSHPQLRRSDKISYLCVDSAELFYHEAFYIGICRPTRNGGSKKSMRQIPYRKYRKTGHTIQKYADGRWGFDDYSSGKRVMIRHWNKQDAEKRSADITAGPTNSQSELPPPPINADLLAEFVEWKLARHKMYRS